MMSLFRRLARFLIFLGTFTLFLFFLTDRSQKPIYVLFFAALMLVIIGFALLRRSKTDERTSNRFRLFRKVFGKSEPDQQEKQE